MARKFGRAHRALVTPLCEILTVVSSNEHLQPQGGFSEVHSPVQQVIHSPSVHLTALNRGEVVVTAGPWGLPQGQTLSKPQSLLNNGLFFSFTLRKS